MATITPTSEEQELIDAYFEAIDFTETGDTGQPESGSEIDEDFGRESIIDCLAFYQRISCYLHSEQCKNESSYGVVAQAGHDFWLTRNGHGCGFWDGDWPTYGDMFTKMAQSFGEAYPQFMSEEEE